MTMATGSWTLAGQLKPTGDHPPSGDPLIFDVDNEMRSSPSARADGGKILCLQKVLSNILLF